MLWSQRTRRLQAHLQQHRIAKIMLPKFGQRSAMHQRCCFRQGMQIGFVRTAELKINHFGWRCCGGCFDSSKPHPISFQAMLIIDCETKILIKSINFSRLLGLDMLVACSAHSVATMKPSKFEANQLNNEEPIESKLKTTININENIHSNWRGNNTKKNFTKRDEQEIRIFNHIRKWVDRNC